MFAETVDFFIIFFNSDESSLMKRKEQRIMLLTFISIYLYIFNRIFFQAENHTLTLSRSSSSYSVSVSLFKCFLSTAVMVFIAQHGLWGKLTSSFHLKSNWERILLKHLKKKGDVNKGKCWGSYSVFWWDNKIPHLLALYQLFCRFWGITQTSYLMGSSAVSPWSRKEGDGLIAAVLYLHQHSPAKHRR